MNTADRSIRSLDVALRRRFDIFECLPDSEILRGFYSRPGHINDVADLIEGFEELNLRLQKHLDRHHTIGHTFFMQLHLGHTELKRIWARKIYPLIEEYFFDESKLAAEFSLESVWPSLTK